MKVPGLGYVNYYTKTNHKRTEISPNSRALDSIQRLDEREAAILRERDQFHNDSRLTSDKINKKRKHEMIKDYEAKFASKVSPGIHKIGLSFQNIIKNKGFEGSKEWWKIGKEVESKGNEISHKRLWDTRKYYAKNDNFVVQDHLDSQVPNDTFKDNRDFTKVEKKVAEKVTNITNFPGYRNLSDMKNGPLQSMKTVHSGT
mmetsp:Transcript_31607/g.28003  ORF Transcript_31607/g.28003 Transcript_31607/m.28003 type:complete len:201 (+) Transcript_31607:863-1465(+)